jgi:cation transport regulator ChaC
LDTNNEYYNQPEGVVDETAAETASTTESFVVPGVPVVRGNTPRPRSMGKFSAKAAQHAVPVQSLQDNTSDFPSEAPVAPPLPEEYEDGETGTIKQLELVSSVPASKPEASKQSASEFMWLFEYGLEMDAAFLNSPDRLRGLALTYGPAVLRGYRIVVDGVEVRAGQLSATIVASQEPGAEVWGILYRVPRRVAEQEGDEPSLLDRVHGAKVFERLEVTVHEVYRKREVTCVTYIAPVAAQSQHGQWSIDRMGAEIAYVQQLLACATRQNLPDDYLAQLKLPRATMRGAPTEPRATTRVAPTEREERNTEPLPVLKSAPGENNETNTEKPAQNEQETIQTEHTKRWLTAFASYLVLMLLATLTLSILQALGYWNEEFPINFALLNVPWYVLVYGLLGACVSGIITVGKQHTIRLPGFVVLTWFARPFIGVILAALAYLFLNSGLFAIAGNAVQHYSLNALAGALAGFCEGWIFFRER